MRLATSIASALPATQDALPIGTRSAVISALLTTPRDLLSSEAAALVPKSAPYGPSLDSAATLRVEVGKAWDILTLSQQRVISQSVGLCR